MQLKKNSSERKLRGAYYTPYEMAKIMVSLIAKRSFSSVLEPSCGNGVFVDCLREHEISNNAHLTAVEIDPIESEKVRAKYENDSHIKVHCGDFFDFYGDNKNTKYDLIIGNPPYIRYQYLTKKQREIQSDILTSNGMKSNKLINAWVAFLIACVHMLDKNGTIAFVIPSEILQIAYAEDLRDYLTTHLDTISLVAFRQSVFEGIEQEILVLLGEKGSENRGIRFVEVENLKEFSELRLEDYKLQEAPRGKDKWIKYFINDDMDILDSIKNDDRFAPFSDYALINVGITTGNNKYFSIDEETAREYDLANVTLPLIGRSSHACGIFFTEEDWIRNIKSGKRAMLLHFPEAPIEEYPKAHIKYIQHGEENSENTGYKCSIRERWYIVPSVWIPDAFFLRRSDRYPKFILNCCNTVSTDTLNRIKFRENILPQDVLLSYYNSITFAFTEACGRSYGGGVLELLPSETSKIMLPKILGTVDNELKKELLSYVDHAVRSNEDIEAVLDVVDKRLLVETLGVSEELCRQCREIWRKLQSRRLPRH